MDNQTQHTKSWIFQTWVAFAASLGGMSWAIYTLPAVSNNTKIFMGLCLLFAVSSSLALAKTMRDTHESEKVENNVDQQALLQFLKENGLLQKEKK